MHPEAAKRLRLLASAVSVLLLAGVVAGGWLYTRIRASRPQLDGAVATAGLSAAVTIERDALGVPTIRGATRADVARALGWLHAQDRFFQMDLLRRVAAGELAEIFGAKAVPRDRASRRHGFRRIAQEVLARLGPEHRAVLEAYTAGVNAGLGALAAPPFEHLVLRTTPRPWRAEDTFLVAFAMTLELQEKQISHELTLMTLRDQLGHDALAFFAPMLTPTDAALDGTTAPLAPTPGPKLVDLRGKKTVSIDPRPAPRADPFPFFARDPEAVTGSNAFALAGAHTASGAALLANDMHLDHGVPNTRYRAVLQFGDRRLAGVTLPGAPVMVAGSNGRVAWGFTSGYVDASDLVVVEPNSIAPTLYTAPGRTESVAFETRTETILVKGAEPVTAEYRRTIWGPILEATDHRQRPLALRWVAHEPEATNLSLLDLENAATTEEAIGLAQRCGIPAQNILIADRAGAIAWTIAGRLPKRVGYDGRLPVPWSFGDRRWEGLLPPEEVPVVRGEESALPGRLWSGNQRHVGGEGLAKIGDGEIHRAPRAAQIRDGLVPLAKATPKDLLAVQLDDRALFLQPWHALLMETLTPAVVAQKKARAELRAAAEKWEGRASPEAVSYRLTRAFRAAVHARVFTPIFAPCVEAYPEFNARRALQLDGACWQILREKPAHLLDAQFTTWEDLLAAAADDTIAAVTKDGGSLAQAAWGRVNRLQMKHPFSRAYPWLSRWLDLPADPLAGDSDMPRAQVSGHGISERIVVSPGREEEGIFHMPGGQSAHPLSPFYRAGHEAWLRGEPTPFLPGKTQHTLTLKP
ncbi:MAG: penicillin acylase family protein [Opitutaceae bacterium]|nr:penicillin acylase family protein [Opitutaceae bacterium]